MKFPIQLSAEQKIDFLESIVLFSKFRIDELKNFVAYLSVKNIKSGEVVVQEGEHKTGMAFLTHGEVDIVKKDDNGNKKIMAHFKKGKIFGEMSLLDGQPSSASVIAKKDVTLLVLTNTQFTRLIRKHPSTAVKLLFILSKMLSARLRLTSGRLVEYLE